MTKVLVVDDEPQILRALRINLSVRGYEVVTASTGGGALRAAADEHPDVVILDLGLPDMSGIDVIGGLRGWLTAPIIVLSARTDSADKVGALDAGADDYVTKPFGMDEFLARLRAAVRRAAAASDTDEPMIETSSFTVDLAAKKVSKNGSEVHLTPTEWGMLEMLVRNRGKLVGRDELLKEVWGPAYAKETHYLRVYLAQLRRKLEDDPSHPVHLLTEAGMGYRFKGYLPRRAFCRRAFCRRADVKVPDTPKISGLLRLLAVSGERSPRRVQSVSCAPDPGVRRRRSGLRRRSPACSRRHSRSLPTPSKGGRRRR